MQQILLLVKLDFVEWLIATNTTLSFFSGIQQVYKRSFNQKEINALTMNSMPLRGYNCAAQHDAIEYGFCQKWEYRQQKFSCGRCKVQGAKEIKVQIFDSMKNICRNLESTRCKYKITKWTQAVRSVIKAKKVNKHMLLSQGLVLSATLFWDFCDMDFSDSVNHIYLFLLTEF